MEINRFACLLALLLVLVVPSVYASNPYQCNPLTTPNRCGSSSGSKPNSGGGVVDLCAFCIQICSNPYSWDCLSASLWGMPEGCKACYKGLYVANLNDDFSIPCASDTGSGEYVWSQYNVKSCPNGCDMCTGICIKNGKSSCQDSSTCYPGTWTCLDNSTAALCSDSNKDGIWGYDGIVTKSCPDGCLNGYCLSDQPSVKSGTSCWDICRTGDHICGGVGGRYSFSCMDYDGDGCLDYLNAYYNEGGGFCTYGCDAATGKCVSGAVGCSSSCVPNSTKCSFDGRSVQTCYDFNGTGCGMFSGVYTYCGDMSKCIEVNGPGTAVCQPLPNYDQVDQVWNTDKYTYALYHFDDSSNGSKVVDSSLNGRDMTFWPSSGCSTPSDCASYQSTLTKFGGSSMQMFNHGEFTWNHGAGTSASSAFFNGTVDFWALVYIGDNNAAFSPFAYILWNSSVYTVIEVLFYRISDVYYAYVYSGDGFSPNSASFVLKGFYPFDWHQFRITWGDNITLYVDGNYVNSSAYHVPSAKRGISDIFIGGYLSGYAMNNSYMLLDEFRVSTVERSFNSSGMNQCYYGQHKCTEPVNSGFSLYSVGCRDINGDGYGEWDYDHLSVPCNVSLGGCNRLTGLCATSSTAVDECIAYSFKCIDGWSSQCLDPDNDAKYQYFRKDKCSPGFCEPLTGECVPLSNLWNCTLGEALCVDNELVWCGDANHDGVYDWDYTNYTICPFGCVGDYDSTTHNFTASCLDSPGDDIIGLRNAVADVGANVNVAFGDAVQKNFVVVLAFAVVFGLCRYLLESSAFGFIAALGTLVAFMSVGWVHPILVGGLILFSSWMIFAAFFESGGPRM
jgi:hypothetical protein